MICDDECYDRHFQCFLAYRHRNMFHKGKYQWNDSFKFIEKYFARFSKVLLDLFRKGSSWSNNDT